MSPHGKYKQFTRALIFIPVAVLAWFTPVSAMGQNLLANNDFSYGASGWLGETSPQCEGGSPSIGGWSSNSVSFSYINKTIYQTVVIENPSTFNFTYTAVNRPETYINGVLNVSISDGERTMSSGNFFPERTPKEYSIAFETFSPNSEITVSISGYDGGIFWAGCYGPSVSNASLIASPTIPSLPSNAVWVEIPENGTSLIEAPQGFVFNDILFASYGTPSGSNGIYTVEWCHSALSMSIVSDALIGKSSAELNASNSIFGDPCGGTYKRLYVTALYSPILTPSTTTTIPETTTTVPETTTTVPETTTTIAGETIDTTESTTTTVLTTTTTEVAKPSVTTQTTVPKPAPITEDEEEKKTAKPETSVAETLKNAEPEEFVAQLKSLNTDEITAEVVEAIIDIAKTGSIDQQQISEAVDAIINAGIDEEKAVLIATTPEIVASLDAEQASEIFSAVDVGDLSDEEAEQLVAAVQNAPDSVRKSFEEEINVFSGAVDSYVPVGSAISVSQRRVVVAVAAAAAAAPAIAAAGRRP